VAGTLPKCWRCSFTSNGQQPRQLRKAWREMSQSLRPRARARKTSDAGDSARAQLCRRPPAPYTFASSMLAPPPRTFVCLRLLAPPLQLPLRPIGRRDPHVRRPPARTHLTPCSAPSDDRALSLRWAPSSSSSHCSRCRSSWWLARLCARRGRLLPCGRRRSSPWRSSRTGFSPSPAAR
jgi:hypothetical protein